MFSLHPNKNVDALPIFKIFYIDIVKHDPGLYELGNVALILSKRFLNGV